MQTNSQNRKICYETRQINRCETTHGNFLAARSPFYFISNHVSLYVKKDTPKISDDCAMSRFFYFIFHTEHICFNVFSERAFATDTPESDRSKEFM